MTAITDSLFIGNFENVEKPEVLASEGVQSILCLNGYLRGRAPESCGVQALRVFDLKDGPGNDPHVFKLAVRAVGELTSSHPKLLVHCHAGRSRSVVVVAGYLMQTHDMTAAEAIAKIAACREIAITPGLAALLDHFSISQTSPASMNPTPPNPRPAGLMSPATAHAVLQPLRRLTLEETRAQALQSRGWRKLEAKLAELRAQTDQSMIEEQIAAALAAPRERD